MKNDTFSSAIDAIRTYAAIRMSENRTPGYQIALTHRDDLIAQIELGVANSESGAPVGKDTLYEFGSIGKSFTAICFMQLAEEGRIDLHAPFENYLPWFKVQSEFEPVTSYHLLSHTAGIICGTDFTPSHPFEVWSLRHTRTTTAPGSQFHYSNLGYKALGSALERIEGKPYQEFIRARILDPLGMANSCAAITSEMRHRLAVGYQNRFDDRPRLERDGLVPAPWLESNSGDGSICASASDLAIFLRMLLNRGAYSGGRLIRKEAFELMSSAHIDIADSGGYGYGYGLALQIDPRSGRFGHPGGMVGYISAMDGNLETGFGAAVFTNSMVNCSAISQFALDALACAAGGAAIPTQKSPDRPPLADYIGTYRNGEGAMEFTVERDELVLIRGESQSVLIRVLFSDDMFVNDTIGERHFPYRFERDGAAAITGVVHGEKQWTKADSATPIPEAPDDYAAYAGHYRAWNPWASNFRIVVRAGKLLMIAPTGDEAELVPAGDFFQVGSDEGLPETLAFHTIVEGLALEARDMLGSTYHRVFTP